MAFYDHFIFVTSRVYTCCEQDVMAVITMDGFAARMMNLCSSGMRLLASFSEQTLSLFINTAQGK
jgi:hypothetical protein